MSKKFFLQNALIIILGAAIIVMSIGSSFAYSDIEFNMSPVITPTIWNVHFENARILDSTTVDTMRIIPPVTDESTNISFGVSLNPGEIYDFSANLKNTGKIDAKITNVIMETLNNEETELLNYSVKYEDGTIVKKDDILMAGETKKIVVHVEDTRENKRKKVETLDYEFNLKINLEKNVEEK